jgi:osmotically-inducible protein OsmY
LRKVKRVFRGPKGYKRSDDRIREDVNDRLSLQEQFDPSELEVSVSNGEVTLTGYVELRHEKFLAEEIADDVNGVTEVHNQLRVGSQASQTANAAAQAGAEAARNRNARAQ